VPGAAAPLSGSRLGRLARRPGGDAARERCELCGEPIAPDHRHLLDTGRRELICACRACSLLFADPAASEGRYRLVGDRRLRVEDLELDDVMWEELRLPVDMAFFFHRSEAGKVEAFYPSPMGPTESLLALDAWTALEEANPLLRTLEPDTEALLVDRVRGARRYWIVPIDECYALVGLIRTRWRGFTGGAEVWREIARFFDELDGRSRPASRNDVPEEAKTWRS
jgi:Family of unknown function (DUF5947)